MQLRIASLWNGQQASERDVAFVEVSRGDDEWIVEVDAPFYDDPAPPGPPGPTPGLWDFEVVEVMWLGREQRYLELELSPHGHYLALQLEGVRNVARSDLRVRYDAAIDAGRFRGRARVSQSLLPENWDRLNAFAIHGRGAARSYLAWRGAPGPRPDFHRLELFGQWLERC
ncbi:MAG: hypothetical protein R3B13_28000 [Polyangiaceae bacterium]